MTFYAVSDVDGQLSEHALILSSSQATDFLHCLGPPRHELHVSMWSVELIAVLERRLQLAVVDVGHEGMRLVVIKVPRGGSTTSAGRPSGTFADWARRLLKVAERAGPHYVA